MVSSSGAPPCASGGPRRRPRPPPPPRRTPSCRADRILQAASSTAFEPSRHPVTCSSQHGSESPPRHRLNTPETCPQRRVNTPVHTPLKRTLHTPNTPAGGRPRLDGLEHQHGLRRHHADAVEPADHPQRDPPRRVHPLPQKQVPSPGPVTLCEPRQLPDILTEDFSKTIAIPGSAMRRMTSITFAASCGDT